MQFKYHTIDEIKQTEKYQELWSAYKANPTRFTAWDLVEYFNEETHFCKEAFNQAVESINQITSQYVDVKDVALGDEAKWTMKCDTERNLKSMG